jgi:DAACS family dicarboxylate/amino acid:cation (Na+ or H+) symporter
MTETASKAKQPRPLHWKIGIGFVIGLVVGMAVHYGFGTDSGWVDGLTTYVTRPSFKNQPDALSELGLDSTSG